ESATERAQRFCFDDEVPRIVEAMQRLGLMSVAKTKGVHLVGHSYGGALALKLALEQPFRVASLAMYEPVAFHVLPSDSAARQEITQVADKMHQLDALAATGAFVDYWNFPGYFTALPEKVQQAMATQAAKVQCDFNALIHEPKRLQDYAEIQVPSLLISGDKSQQSAQHVAALLANTLVNRQVQQVNAGHMAPLTNPELVNPLFVDFLSAQAYPS
ncbi:alpha/beta hydrolase, partial [Thalassospira xiamenensis]